MQSEVQKDFDHFIGKLELPSPRWKLNLKFLINFLKQNDNQLTNIHLVNDLTKKQSIHAFQSELITSNGESYYGLSCKKNETSQVLSLIELLERYLYREKVFQEGSYRIPMENLNVKSWKDYAFFDVKEHYNINGEVSDLGLSVTPAIHLNSMNRVLIDSVFFLGNDTNYNQSTSGCAAHLSEQEAVHHALLELLERHSLMLNWIEEIAPEEILNIDFDSLDISLDFYEEMNYRVRVLRYIDEFGLNTVVFTLMSKANDYPSFFVGTACDFTLDKAIVRAHEEARSSWIFNSKLNKEVLNYDGFDQPKFYYIPENAKELDCFYSNGGNVEYKSIIQNLEPDTVLISILDKIDLFVLPVYTDKSMPLWIRLYSPQLFPMFFGVVPPIVPRYTSNIKEDLNPHPY